MMKALLIGYCAAFLATQPAAPPVEQQTRSAGRATSPEMRKLLGEAALLTLGEDYRRMTIPVVVDGKGPYPFIIDTGAERTVISSQLAKLLDLSDGPKVTIAAMSGSSVVGTYQVPKLAVEQLADVDDVTAPGLDKYDLGAHGLLGLDVLEGHRIRFDFGKRQMAVEKSAKRRLLPPRSDEIIVSAQRIHHRLVLTDASYRGHPVRVLIDTGSTLSVGNPALKKLLSDERDIGKGAPIRSVTGQDISATFALVDGLKIGTFKYRSLPVAFSEKPPFQTFAPGDAPVLILGLDALRAFEEVDIDFTNTRITFHIPKRGYVPPQLW